VTGQRAAVKVLYDRYRSEPKIMQRFAQEARLLLRLIHPNIARAIAYSIEGEHAYLAMEYVAGRTLAGRLMSDASEQRHIPLSTVSWLCDQLCAAIAHSHTHGIVHRDLKPTNVMVNLKRGKPFLKVLDFGVAKVLGAVDVDPTTVGKFIGSTLYLAPEQITRGTCDGRSDVFAIATMVFEMVTLRRGWARTADGAPLPFDFRLEHSTGNNQLQILHRIAREERPSAASIRPDVTREIDAVLAKGMAIEPEARYATPIELALAFREAVEAKRVETGDFMLRDPLGMLETIPEVRAVKR
jgi:serine/threonine-protein kinase